MSDPLPLADAAARLRGKPGRPRKKLSPEETTLEEHARRARQRLHDITSAAHYLGGVSPWTVRDLIASGRLPRVRLPLGGQRELRRVLVDERDLDRLIEASKDCAEASQ